MEPGGGATELRIDRLSEVRVALNPYISILALITDALGRRRGAPEAWRHRILKSLSPRSIHALLPMAAPRYSVMPDCITPRNPASEVSIKDQVEWLHDISETDLHRDIEGVFGETPPPHWRKALEKPRRWLDAYADTMGETWTQVAPLWSRARPLLEREVERVGTAAVRGRLDLVLSGLHPASRFENDVLKIRDPEPAHFDLGGRPLVLVPMLSGREALICNFDGPEAVWIGYPLPGVDRLYTERLDATSTRPLETMLGSVRAAVLLAVERPLTMGELAELTDLAPSAVTYHCGRLAAAGLVERQRHGREVRVFRTERGEALLKLFTT